MVNFCNLALACDGFYQLIWNAVNERAVTALDLTEPGWPEFIYTDEDRIDHG